MSKPAIKTDPVERHDAHQKRVNLRSENRDLIRRLKESDQRARVRSALSGRMPTIKPREFKSGLREATAVALLSDLHVEERVLKGDTPTGNEYSLDIAARRLERFFAGLDWLIKKERGGAKIRNLLLWWGGDMMSGHIHEENLETSAAPPIKTLLWLYPHLVGGLEFLKAKTDVDIDLVCSYGNHGRDTKKCNYATGAHHSYEWGMYQIAAEHYRNDPRVKVYADPTEHQYAKVYGFDLHFHHGNRINYGGGVGGITIPINKAVAQWDRVRRCDYHNFGHFHQYIDTGNVVVNGSLIGFNSYAMGIKASPEPPQQAFYLIDSKRGKTAKSPIWVGES